MTTTPEWSSTGRPKGTPSRTQQVRMTITDYIVREGLKTGKPIPPESKLMELTGASRSAVREALKVMEALGFVTIKRGAGTFVNDITLEALTTQLIFASQRDAKNGYSVLRDVVKLRAVLESSLMRLACRAENQNIDELRIIIARMEAEQRAGYVTTDTDREFHVALYKDLGNALYAPLIAALFDAYIRVPFEPPSANSNFPTRNATRHSSMRSNRVTRKRVWLPSTLTLTPSSLTCPPTDQKMMRRRPMPLIQRMRKPRRTRKPPVQVKGFPSLLSTRGTSPAIWLQPLPSIVRDT